MSTRTGKVSISSSLMVGPILELFNQLSATSKEGKVVQAELRRHYLKGTGLSRVSNPKLYSSFNKRFCRAIRFLTESETLVKTYGTDQNKHHAVFLQKPTENEQ